MAAGGMVTAQISLRRLLFSAVLVAQLVPAPVTGQDVATNAPALSIASITVSPQTPSADTLCRLTVTLSNKGDKAASQLGFRVVINGIELPVYSNQLFMYPVGPGATSEISLFNFWSTETSRPFPADGKLTVEVTLTEAQWTSIEDIDGVETWTPLGAVPGLPVSSSVTLAMSR
jgi:hypothetical protein